MNLINHGSRIRLLGLFSITFLCIAGCFSDDDDDSADSLHVVFSAKESQHQPGLIEVDASDSSVAADREIKSIDIQIESVDGDNSEPVAKTMTADFSRPVHLYAEKISAGEHKHLGGRYKITVTVTDDQDHAATDSIDLSLASSQTLLLATDDSLACQAVCSSGTTSDDLNYYSCQLDAGSESTANTSCDLEDLLASVSTNLADLDEDGFTSVDANSIMQITALGGSGGSGQDGGNSAYSLGAGGASGISSMFTTLNMLKLNYFDNNSPVLYYFLGEQGVDQSAGGAASIVASNDPSTDNPLIIPDLTTDGLDNTQANVLLIAGGGGGGGSSGSSTTKMNGFDGGAGAFAIPEAASWDAVSVAGSDGGTGTDLLDSTLAGGGGASGAGGIAGLRYQANGTTDVALAGNNGIGGEGGTLASSTTYADWVNTDISPVFTFDGEAGKGANATLQTDGDIEFNLASGGGGYGGGGGAGANTGFLDIYHSAGAGGGGSYAAPSIVIPTDSVSYAEDYQGDGELFVVFYDQTEDATASSNGNTCELMGEIDYVGVKCQLSDDSSEVDFDDLLSLANQTLDNLLLDPQIDSVDEQTLIWLQAFGASGTGVATSSGAYSNALPGAGGFAQTVATIADLGQSSLYYLLGNNDDADASSDSPTHVGQGGSSTLISLFDLTTEDLELNSDNLVLLAGGGGGAGIYYRANTDELYSGGDGGDGGIAFASIDSATSAAGADGKGNNGYDDSVYDDLGGGGGGGSYSDGTQGIAGLAASDLGSLYSDADGHAGFGGFGGALMAGYDAESATGIVCGGFDYVGWQVGEPQNVNTNGAGGAGYPAIGYDGCQGSDDVYTAISMGASGGGGYGGGGAGYSIYLSDELYSGGGGGGGSYASQNTQDDPYAPTSIDSIELSDPEPEGTPGKILVWFNLSSAAEDTE